jgi:hypothetical protein
MFQMLPDSKSKLRSGLATRFISEILLLTQRLFLEPKQVEELRLLLDYERSHEV